MSGQNGESGDRTEAPTARRLQQAFDEGQVPLSREAVLLAGLAAMTLAFLYLRAGIGRALTRPLSILLNRPDLPLTEPLALYREIAMAALGAILPLAAPIALAAAAATLLQTRLALRTKALAPDFSRLSPGKGLGRLLGMENLVETGKSLAKLLAAGFAVAFVLRGILPRLMVLPSVPLALLPDLLARTAIKLLFAVVAAQTAIAGIDIFWVWRHHQQMLRMSRSDIRDEHKETEGDPQIKARIRNIRVRRARQRMLAAVPKATVVVTNPTHYAVALTYDSTRSNVPVLVAKGVDSMALRIRETAMKHGVPIVADPPLARTLHQLPLGASIPPELYKAVAELIAYVWRLGARGRA